MTYRGSNRAANRPASTIAIIVPMPRGAIRSPVSVTDSRRDSVDPARSESDRGRAQSGRRFKDRSDLRCRRAAHPHGAAGRFAVLDAPRRRGAQFCRHRDYYYRRLVARIAVDPYSSPFASVFLSVCWRPPRSAVAGRLIQSDLDSLCRAIVGLGADFAIQYSVRYRAQRHELHDLKPSLVGAARLVGAPLTLAAFAAAAGFLSFVDRLSRRRRTRLDRRGRHGGGVYRQVDAIAGIAVVFRAARRTGAARLCGACRCRSVSPSPSDIHRCRYFADRARWTAILI